MAEDKDKKELSGVEREGLSGGFKPHQWPDNPTQVPESEVPEETLAGLSGGRKGEEEEEEEILTPHLIEING